MDALLRFGLEPQDESYFGVSTLYQVDASLSNASVISTGASIINGPKAPFGGDELLLSLVGYDQPSLLYNAIRDHHEHLSGHQLSHIPSFGGIKEIRLGPADLMLDRLSFEAYDFAYGSAIRVSAFKIERIVNIVGPGIYHCGDRELFDILISLSPERLAGVTAILEVIVGGIDGDDRDFLILDRAVPKIRSLLDARAASRGEARASDTMKEADAAHKIQQLKEKVVVALAAHYHHTRLTRRALQNMGYLPACPARVDGLTVVVLQGILDYLKDDALLRGTITSSVLQSVGGPSPQRTRTICADPDAEVAAIMKSGKGAIEYTGDNFEKLMCLVPLGSALTVVLVKHFIPSVNRDIAVYVESLSNLSFLDSRRQVSIGPAYARLSKLIASVTRSGMVFSVLTVYRYLAKAMSESTYQAHDGGEWRSLCHKTLRTCQTYQVNATMPRDVLDDTMSMLRNMMDTEADERGLDQSFGASFLPSPVSLHTDVGRQLSAAAPYSDPPPSYLGSAWQPPYGPATLSVPPLPNGLALARQQSASQAVSQVACDQDEYQYEPSIYDEYGLSDLTISQVNARLSKPCPCGAVMAFATDYCVACSQFLPGTMVCKQCRAPRLFRTGMPARCRNFGLSLACASTEFVTPALQDKQMALRAHQQRMIISAERQVPAAKTAVSQPISQPPAVSKELVPYHLHQPDKSTPQQGKGKGGGGKGKGGGGPWGKHRGGKGSEVHAVAASRGDRGGDVNERQTPVELSNGAQSDLIGFPEPPRVTFKAGFINAVGMVTSIECPEKQLITLRCYNAHGFDASGEHGLGLSNAEASPEQLAEPFIYSIDGLTAQGRDKFGSIPESPTMGQRAELDGLHELAWRQQALRISAVAAEIDHGVAFRVPTHVVPEQATNILAVCDLEKVGMSFHNVTDDQGCRSWLDMRGGGGINLLKNAGLFYLQGTVNPAGGIIIGCGGDIHFLIDSGAQASIIGQRDIHLLTGFTSPSVTMSSAGGHALNVVTSATLRMQYRAGMASLVSATTTSAPSLFPPSLFLGEVRATAGNADLAAPIPLRRGRFAQITNVDALHYRFGFTDPAVFKVIQGMTIGVSDIKVPSADRFVSTTMALSAARRRMIRHHSVPHGLVAQARPGERASADFTRHFEPDLDGHVAAVIFMDRESREIFSYPTLDKTGESFVLALRAYREHIRSTKPGIELLSLVADCDVSWTTVSYGGELRPTEAVRAYLEGSARSLSFTRSPPYSQALNPVEGACTRLYYNMNFFLHLAMLNMVAWYDMLRAAVYAFNVTPHVHSERLDLRSKTPYELSRGVRPDLSHQIAHPGQMVALLSHGTKSSAGADRSVLGYYICPSELLAGSGWLCREYKSRVLRETGHLYVMPPYQGCGSPESSVASGGILRTDLAPRSVALYHALDSELFRGGHGVMTPDAATCVGQARALFRSSGTAHGDDCVLWLDGVTGIPTRLSVIIVPDDSGGSFGLAPDGIVELVPVSGGQAAAGPLPHSARLDSMPTTEVVAPGGITAPFVATPGGMEAISDIRDWIVALPDSTPVHFEQGFKTPGTKCGERYAAYKGAKTIGEYRRAQTKEFVWKDFKYDLAKGLVSLPPAVWSERLRDSLRLAPEVSAIFAGASDSTGDVGAVTLDEMVVAWAERADLDMDKALRIWELSVGDTALNRDTLAAQPDRLGGRAESLALHDPVMKRTIALEMLEDGPTHPAIIGGPLVDCMAAEGLLAYRIASITASKLQSFKQLSAHPSWSVDGGFKDKLKEELAHVIDIKKALVLVPYREYATDRARYGDRCETKHLLTPATEKLMADGSHARLKVRLVLADIRGVFQIDRTFSATVNDESIRFLESFLLGREDAIRRVLDVKGAYFEGKVPTPEEGGRVLYARVPSGWGEIGYPEFDEATGKPNYFKVVGNVPGRQDAGVIWQDEYDAWLFGQGFSQSVVDRRVFFKSIVRARGGIGLFVIGVFVDDNWTHCECPVAWEIFYAKWVTRFKPSLTNDMAGRDFCGVTFDDKPDGSVELSCGKLLAALLEMVSDDIKGMSFDTPMASDALSAIRALPTAENPLLGERFVHRARQILGLILYVVRCARPESAFGAVALSQQIGTNLTKATWGALLRLSCYLVSTPEKRLIYRPNWTHGQKDFVCNCDSSCINMPTDLTSFDASDSETSLGQGPIGASMGGFATFFEDSGAFQWEVFSPRKLALSSAGSELTMASWAGKSIIAWRMLQRELRLAPLGPTILEMDASAVLDGVKMERVTRLQRYQSARLATLRMWVHDLVLSFRKTTSADMRADALSKPVQPAAAFHRLASLLLTGREIGSN